MSSEISTILFEAFDSNDVMIMGSMFELIGRIIYGTKFKNERWNQVANRTLDAKLNVDDNGMVVVTGQIKLKGTDDSVGFGFRDWILTYAIFQLNRFSMTPPIDIDLGLGKGVPIPFANFTKADDSSVFEDAPPDVWIINFPYNFVRVL